VAAAATALKKTRETRLELLFPSTLSKLLRRRYARASLLYFEPRNALIPPLTLSMTDSGSDWTGSVDHTRLPLAIAITKASFRFDSDRERVLLRRSLMKEPEWSSLLDHFSLVPNKKRVETRERSCPALRRPLSLSVFGRFPPSIP